MTDKQPKALRIADALDELDTQFYSTRLLCEDAAAELRRLHEVNTKLLEVFKLIRFEKVFACECGIEDATWELIEAAIAQTTGEQQ